MVYKDSLDKKKRHFHFGEFLHFQFGTNSGFIDQMLQRYDYEPQAYRSCSLVLGKYRNFSYKLLNDVAQECLEHGKISVSRFDKVIKVMESNAYRRKTNNN